MASHLLRQCGMESKPRDYRGLSVWQRALDLVVAIYQITEGFPAAERFGLTSQLRRAAVSLPANIAEGNSRLSRAAYLNHLNVALGSLGELRALIEVSLRLQFLSETQQSNLSSRIDEVGRMLYGLRKALQPHPQPD